MQYNVHEPMNITVTDIEWEHIYLRLTLAGDIRECYTFGIGKIGGKKYPLTYEGNQIVCNIVNIPDVYLMPSGKWGIFVRDEEKGVEELLHVSAECGYRLENLDKIYRYAAENCMYTVSFGIWDGQTVCRMAAKAGSGEPEIKADELYLFVHTDYMRKNHSGSRRNILAETSGIRGFLHGAAVRLTKKGLNALYQVMFRLRKKDGKNVLLMSETRTPIGGNLKALDDRLHERHLDSAYHLSYSFSKTLEQSKTELVKSWLRLLWLIAGQDYIFVDDYVPVFQSISLRPETKLIQLWHAGVGFKSVGYARFGRKGSPHPTDSCHRRYDYAIVGAKGLIPVYEEVFGIPEDHFRAYGLPRLDGYNDPEKKEEFCSRFYGEHPEMKNRKIILFAPTFRGNGQRDAGYPMERVNLKAAWEMCGEEYIFVIKMHPFVPPLDPVPEEYSDRIVNFSTGYDINELFYVTEILITDFSSNIYEFALQDKPMLFYAYDKDFYQLTRGVHRRLEDFAPGKICTTFDELICAIKEKDFQEERRGRFLRESFEPHVGYAADRIIDEILRA